MSGDSYTYLVLFSSCYCFVSNITVVQAPIAVVQAPIAVVQAVIAVIEVGISCLVMTSVGVLGNILCCCSTFVRQDYPYVTHVRGDVLVTVCVRVCRYVCVCVCVCARARPFTVQQLNNLFT